MLSYLSVVASLSLKACARPSQGVDRIVIHDQVPDTFFIDFNVIQVKFSC